MRQLLDGDVTAVAAGQGPRHLAVRPDEMAVRQRRLDAFAHHLLEVGLDGEQHAQPDAVAARVASL